MSTTHRQMTPLASAALLGVVAGMRTQLPFALLANAARAGRFAVQAGPPLALLRASRSVPITALSAAGELIGDKLPMTPSRLDPGPLAGRFLFGSLAGAAMLMNAGRSPLAGALLGAAGAGLGAFGGFHLRRRLGQATAIPGPLLGLIEDGVALTLGAAAIRASGKAE